MIDGIIPLAGGDCLTISHAGELSQAALDELERAAQRLVDVLVLHGARAQSLTLARGGMRFEPR